MIDDEDGEDASGIDNSRYTHEQKIVAAVWVHEKEFNNQSWRDINNNFMVRFNLQPPNRTTFLNWERKLFSLGHVEDKEKCGRPLSRLMHVPYVKASLRDSPNLSLRERSRLLGLPRTTLLKIIRDDLNMQFEIDPDVKVSTSATLKRKHSPYCAGKWKRKSGEEEHGQEESNEIDDVKEIGNYPDQKVSEEFANFQSTNLN